MCPGDMMYGTAISPVDKEWGVFKGDELLLKGETRQDAEKEAQLRGVEDFTVLAIPKPYYSVIL